MLATARKNSSKWPHRAGAMALLAHQHPTQPRGAAEAHTHRRAQSSAVTTQRWLWAAQPSPSRARRSEVTWDCSRGQGTGAGLSNAGRRSNWGGGRSSDAWQVRRGMWRERRLSWVTLLSLAAGNP